MPNIINFDTLLNVREVEVNPDGWIKPLLVEYGEGYLGTTPAYHWRVKGTRHTFAIPVIRMQYLSSGDYVKHFKEVLIGFREDYIEWHKNNFYTDWMIEYKKQYSKFILLS